MSKHTLEKIKTYCRKVYSRSHVRRHDVEHVERVRDNAFKIVKVLEIRSLDKNLLEALCYLHDIPICEASRGTVLSHLFVHVFEKAIIRKRISSLIGQFPLSKEEKKIVITAITNHPYSLPYHCLNKTGDVYSKILQDADSLDYVSGERQKQFEKAHPRVRDVARLYLSFLRKNIRRFLNFPQLANVHDLRSLSSRSQCNREKRSLL